MIFYLVVMGIVGSVTGYFFGGDAAIKVGLELTGLWIGAGLLITIFEPIIGLARIFHYFTRRVISIFHR